MSTEKNIFSVKPDPIGDDIYNREVLHMQIHFEELEKQIDFLMAAAIQKCGNIPEAEELTQETLLGAPPPCPRAGK